MSDAFLLKEEIISGRIKHEGNKRYEAGSKI
jgi:hypothetical protein